MNVREAKDFLVDQAAQRAAVDGIPLSDLEKRMMYFSESDPTCEDPLTLNDEFEAQHSAEEYEPKIAGLLKRAYSRIRKEDPGRKGTWDEAIRELKKGDHYILVLWSIRPPSEHPTRDFFAPIGIGSSSRSSSQSLFLSLAENKASSQTDKLFEFLSYLEPGSQRRTRQWRSPKGSRQLLVHH